MCIRYRVNVSIEPLPSNDRGIFTEPLAINDKGIYTEPLPSRGSASIIIGLYPFSKTF
jgi:hypothetical protein